MESVVTADWDRPPVVLIHGAANSSRVFGLWQQELQRRGWSSVALDLRGHGSSTVDLSDTTMDDYVQDVVSMVRQLGAPPVLVGWSMGGLVAMMTAEDTHAIACVGLAPSTPSTAIDERIELTHGVFDSTVYGITTNDPESQRSMPDLDREERETALASKDYRIDNQNRRRPGWTVTTLDEAPAADWEDTMDVTEGGPLVLIDHG